MRRGVSVVLALVVLSLLTGSAWADMLDFEDLYPGHESTGWLVEPYHGFFLAGTLPAWMTKYVAVPSGYHNTIDGNVGIFTPGARPIAFFRAQPFDVGTVRIGAAWNDDQYVTIQGWLGATLVGQVYAVVGYGGETLTLNFEGIDTLKIIPDIYTGTDHDPNDGGAGPIVVLDDINLEIGGGPQPPEANAGPDQTVEQTSAAGTLVTLDGSASAGTPPLNFAWYEGGALLGTGPVITHAFSLGTHTITLWVTDANGQWDSDDCMVTVRDRTPPMLTAPGDVTAEQTSRDGTPVDIGEATASDICDADVDVSSDAPAVFPLGDTVVTWTAVDDSGNSATGTQTVTVVDTAAPTLTLTILQSTLWPVNHKLVLAAMVGASDVCDAAPGVSVVVTSNEPINGPGDGNTDPDWIVVQNGDVWQIWLRAERAGPSSGRQYTITATVSDASGNVTTKSGVVTVPHDQKKK